MQQRYAAVFTLFVLASITDLFDGYLARNLSGITKLGTMLDPLADRLLLASTLAIVWIQGLAGGLTCLLLIVRDLLAIAGYQAVKSATGVVVSVRWPGKISSALTMIALGAVLVQPSIGQILLSVALAAAYISLLDYLQLVLPILKQKQAADIT